MSEPFVNRIYDLKIAGYDDSIQKIEALTLAFKQMDDAKRKLNIQLQEKIDAGDQQAVGLLIKQIKDLQAEMDKLKAKRDSAAKEQALLAKAEKDSADALLKKQKATESLAKTEQIRINSSIQQEKELDRQIDREERQFQKLEKERVAVEQLEKSYNDLRNQRLALEKITDGATSNTVFSVKGETFNYSEALTNIQLLKTAEDELLQKLNIEKNSREQVNKIENEKLEALRIEKTELQQIVNATNSQSTSISFRSQNLQYSEAIEKIKQLEAAENELNENRKIKNQEANISTNQVINSEENEIKTVISLEESYKNLKNQRIELQNLVDNGTKESVFKINDQTFNYSDALDKIRQLKTEEKNYTEQLGINEQSRTQIIKSLQQEINLVKIERLELEKTIGLTNQSSSVSFKGQTFNYDQALSQIREMNALEVQFTEKLNVEKTVHETIVQSQQESIDVTRRQITELETLVRNSSNQSSISFNGQSFNHEDALSKIRELQSQEKIYIDELNKERSTQEIINAEHLQKINSLKTERVELENIIKNSQQQTTVSFKGEDFNYSEAIEKVHQLETAESELNVKLQQQGSQTKILAGNYYQLLAAQRQAIDIYRLTPSDSPIFEDIQQEAIKATNAVQAFNRTLTPDGTLVGEYKTGILNAFKDLGLSDVLKTQRNEIQSQLNQLKTESQELAAEYRKSGSAGTAAFKEVEQQLVKNLQQQEQVKKSLSTLDDALKNTGSVGSQISSGIAEGFKNAKSQLSQILVGYVGFQAVFQGLQSGVGIASELADQTTNLEIELNKSAGSGKKLVDELAKLDTRTKLTGLEDIANIAAKAGVAEDKIVGVTQSIDKIKIAFGKDFGDVEAGTESLVKLVNVFEGTDQVTGDNLLKVGNAVRTLANETVASVPFLNDFSRRMAGLKGISDISLPAVLGLGSGFEQFGQSAEVAGTTLTKVIPKLATDTEKYSKIAGITQQAFSDLIKNNPAEALIKVSEGLVKSKGGIEEISAAFADSELGSGRIAAILGTVGNKADDFRKAIESAGKAYNDTGNIEEAFAAKNKNLSSTLDKVSKAFADTANSATFQAIINAIAVSVIFLVNNFPALISILGLYATGWALANREMLIAKAEFIFQRTILPILTFLVGGHANAMYASALATEFASKALRTFSALMGNPVFKIFAATVGLGLIAVESFGKSLNNVANAYDKFAQKQKFLNEIQATASKQLSETKAKEEALLAIVKDRTLADGTRAKALENLKNIGGGYLDQLTLENVLTEKGTKLIDDFNSQLERKARLTAADAIAQRENNKLAQLYQNQYDIQTAIKTKGSINTSQFSKEFLDAFYEQQGRSASTIGKFIGDKVGIDFTYSGKDLDLFARLVQNQIKQQLSKTVGSELAKTQVTNDNIKSAAKDLKDAKTQVDELTNKLSGIKEGTKEYADASKNLSDAQQDVIRKREELFKLINKPASASDSTSGGTEDMGKVTIDELKKQLASVNQQIISLDSIKNKSETQLSQLKKLRAQREDILRQIKELSGPADTNRYRGSRLTGQQKDAFKDIDANKDEQIAEQKLLFKQLVIDEQQYLQNVLRINETAADAKLKLLKGNNAEERKQIAELRLFKIEQEETTNKQIFDIKKKQLDTQLESIKKQSEIQLSTVTDDPTKTEQDKRKAREASYLQIYVIQLLYNQKIDELRKKYHQISIQDSQREKDDLLDIERKYTKEEIEILRGSLEEIDTTTEKAVTKIKIKYDQLRASILNSNASEQKKNTAISILDETQNIKNAAINVNAGIDKADVASQLAEIGIITKEEYEKILDQVAQDQQKLADLINSSSIKVMDIRSLISNKISSLFNFGDVQGDINKVKQAAKDLKDGLITQDDFDKISESVDKNINLRKLFAETATLAFDSAKDAMNNYFDAEESRIQRSNKIAQKRLDIELQQAKNRADSQAEQDSLDRQFQAKKDAADKEAFEKSKKLQIEQAKINLAIQLSNLAVIAFAPSPANIATLGIAGAIMYGVQAGLAVVNYALNVSRIKSAQYAKGGYTGAGNERDSTGHRVAGVVHEDEWVSPKWMVKHHKYGPVIQELEEVRKKGTTKIFTTNEKRLTVNDILYSKKGFASGGFAGIGNEPLGNNLQAPFNPEGFLNPGSSRNNAGKQKTEDQMNNLMAMIAETSRQTNSRIDKLTVVLDPNAVQKHNDKTKKATAIGTL